MPWIIIPRGCPLPPGYELAQPKRRQGPGRPLFICPHPKLLSPSRKFIYEQIRYRTKDNSKLRRLLRERSLSDQGNRDDLIARLEKSFVEYNSRGTAELGHMLNERCIEGCGNYTKEMKIARLRLNDKLDRDTGNPQEARLYREISKHELVIQQLLDQQRSASNSAVSFSTLDRERLESAARSRHLSVHGSPSILIKRIQSYDRKVVSEKLKAARDSQAAARKELESQIGHPLDPTSFLYLEEREQAEANICMEEMQLERASVPANVCDYDWRSSRWRNWKEQDLAALCRQRGILGSTNKAGMVKWLDTGKLEYKYYWTTSLRTMCSKRGLQFKASTRRDELVKLLQEDDAKKGTLEVHAAENREEAIIIDDSESDDSSM